MVLNLGIFVSSQKLQLNEFDGADFKYVSSCFNFKFLVIPARKFPNQAYLVPNLGIFIFSRKLGIRKIRGY